MSVSPRVYVGWDSREPVASDVCAHSIRSRTKKNINIIPLKHRNLRQQGLFQRPWLVESDTGNWRDLVDNKPFSTEFSHTRFLVPALMNHEGWALFMDSDMIFQSPIEKLFDLKNDKYAVMCVKHNHKVKEGEKMDGREQLNYHRKNWSSFILFNCNHPSNKVLTPDYVNARAGKDLHAFCWLEDHEIGALPTTYNWISGVSPVEFAPDVIHYTEGGPWFDNCRDVQFAEKWTFEYEKWQRESIHGVTSVPTTKHDLLDRG